MNPPLTTTLRELAFRENDGIEVTLYWNSGDGALSVFVFDERTGDAFALAVGADDPLDVFEHPFAYAARREPELTFPEPVAYDALAA